MVGELVYPLPAFTIVTPVIRPSTTVAIPVAVVPPAGGGEKVTCGLVP